MTQQLISEHLAQACYGQYFLSGHAPECQLLTVPYSDPRHIPKPLSGWTWLFCLSWGPACQQHLPSLTCLGAAPLAAQPLALSPRALLRFGILGPGPGVFLTVRLILRGRLTGRLLRQAQVKLSRGIGTGQAGGLVHLQLSVWSWGLSLAFPMGALSLLLLLELFFLQAALLLAELGPAVLEPYLGQGEEQSEVRRKEMGLLWSRVLWGGCR